MKMSLARSPSATSASSSSRVASAGVALHLAVEDLLGVDARLDGSGTARLPWRRRAAVYARSRPGTCRPGRGRRFPRPRREHCLPASVPPEAGRTTGDGTGCHACSLAMSRSRTRPFARVPCIRWKQRLESGQNSHAAHSFFAIMQYPVRRRPAETRRGYPVEAQVRHRTEADRRAVAGSPRLRSGEAALTGGHTPEPGRPDLRTPRAFPTSRLPRKTIRIASGLLAMSALSPRSVARSAPHHPGPVRCTAPRPRSAGGGLGRGRPGPQPDPPGRPPPLP